MLTALLVGFQLVVTIFLGIFARNDSSTSTISSYHPLYTNCAILTLSFTLVYAPLRKLPLYALASLLLTIGTTVQSYLLLATFWDSCFKGFNSTFTVDTTLIVRSLFASLTVLLTALDFLGLFCYWQAYLIIAPIMTFGTSLTGAILIRGLNIFDGGGGLLIFLYSGVTSLVIWAILIRGKLAPTLLTPRKSYMNHTLGFVGIILLFINWPKFNAAGSLLSYINVDTTSITTDYLMNSAIANTFLALSASVLLAFFLAEKESQEKKMSFSTFASCIINVQPFLTQTGISVASFQDLAMDPIATIIISVAATLLTLVIEGKMKGMNSSGGLGQLMAGYPRIIYHILFSTLGIIICSIVVAARNSRSPALLTANYSKIAGLEIVGFLLVLAFASIFGAIAGFCLKMFLNSKLTPKESAAAEAVGVKKQVKPGNDSATLQDLVKVGLKVSLEDTSYFSDLNEEEQPLYYDMFSNLKELEKDNYTFVKEGDKLKQILLGDLANPLRTMLIKEHITVPPAEAQKNKPIQITRTFTRGNLHKNQGVSEMKKIQNEGSQQEEREVNKLPLESKKAKKNHVETNLENDSREERGGGSSSRRFREMPEKNKYYETYSSRKEHSGSEVPINKEQSRISGILPEDYDSKEAPISNQNEEGLPTFENNMLVSKASRSKLGNEPANRLATEKEDDLDNISFGDNMMVSRPAKSRLNGAGPSQPPFKSSNYKMF